MLDEGVRKALEKFSSEVTKNAKSILRKKKKDSSLEASISAQVVAQNDKFELQFFMNDYWEYVDAGVKGAGGMRKYKNGEKLDDPKPWKLKKVTNNKFKYTKNAPPIDAFGNWIKKKGLQPRDAKGKFISTKDFKFALSKVVFHTGIETTNFFEDSFYNELDRMVDIIEEEVYNAIIIEI